MINLIIKPRTFNIQEVHPLLLLRLKLMLKSDNLKAWRLVCRASNVLGGKIRRGVAESWLGSIWEDENKWETFLYLYANWTTLSMCSAVSFLFVSQFGVFVFIKSSFDERCPVSNTAGCLGTTSLRWIGVKISLVMPLYELAASSVAFLRPTQVKWELQVVAASWFSKLGKSVGIVLMSF